MERLLIGGEWRPASAPEGAFRATDPRTGTASTEEYPVSGPKDVERALLAAKDAAEALRATPKETLARFLDEYASRIEANASSLVEIAALETGLPASPRLLSVELPRTTLQLRQGAAAAKERSWCLATIDTKAEIRSMHAPLGGPVVVFGPNNFPFAFNSVAGGDFVAAIAAGNPVIAKANPGHPGTTRRLAECAQEAALACGLPAGTVQLLYATLPELGVKLVSDPSVGATGFTGSRSGGLRLKEAADRAGKPIFLEMSSVNPVFLLEGALSERLSAIAKELSDSCSLGAGQFCTKPGLTIVPKGDMGEALVSEVRKLFEGAPLGTLLDARGPASIAEGIGQLVAQGAEVVAGGKPVSGPRFAFESTLLRVGGDAFLENPKALQREVFGTVNVVVVARDAEQLKEIARSLEGSLTGTIYTDTRGSDDGLYAELAPLLRTRVGRLLNDKMPTGVAVTPAMNHGGPYPATGHPGFTSVGIPASLLRFSALHCFDHVRPHRLPAELANRNPTGTMWRMIDGEWSQRDVAE